MNEKNALADNEIFLRRVFFKHVTSSIFAMFGAMASMIANSVLAGAFFGADGLALMSIIVPFYSVFAALGSLVGVGGSTVCAYALGRDDSKAANEAFSLSALLGFVLALLAGGFCCGWLDVLLPLLGCTPELYEEAYRCSVVCLLGGFGTTLFYLPYNFLKLLGKLRLLLVVFLGMAAANIALDLLFVCGFGCGVAGVVWGTAVATVGASAVGITRLFFAKDAFRPSFSMNAALLRQIVSCGTPSALNNLLIFFRLLFLNRLVVAAAGSSGLAALSVVTAIENFALVILGGLAQATAGFVSVFTQEMDTVSVRRIERQAHRIGVFLMLLTSAVMFLFPMEVCRAFGMSGAAEAALGTQALHIFAVSLVPSMWCYLLFFYYQAAGFTKLANVLIFGKSFLFLLVPAWLLSKDFGLVGVWSAYTLSAMIPLAILFLVRPFYARRGYAGLLLQDRRAERDGRYISFSVRADAHEIVASSAAIETFCRQNGVVHKDNLLVCLAVEEMLLSIREHAFADDNAAMIDVRLLVLAEADGLAAVLRIRSGGKLFNPLDYYEHRKTQDPLALGDALGLAMILQAAEAIHYKTTFGVNNLTVRMKCGQEAGG
ncbi:MATE family efflux transporter [Selenomonas sp.]|uniref:MATE family efflux transporter n=1 Tax=Selenomonas sp. TaxID=2053611 RepID=UPI003FA24E7D